MSTVMDQEVPRTEFARNTAITFASQVISFLSSLAVGIVLARTLGAEGKGGYTLISSTVLLVALLVNAGVPAGVTFFVARHKWPPLPTLLLGSACTLGPVVLFMLLFHVAGADLVLRRAGFSEGVAQLTWLALTILLPAYITTAVVAAVLRGRELIRQAVWPSIVSSLLRATATVYLLLMVRRELVAVVFADLTAGVTGLFLMVMVFLSALRRWPPTSSTPSARRLLGYGVQMQAGNVLANLWTRGDLYLVNFLVGQGAVGLYSVAMVFAEFSNFPSLAVTSVLFPRLASTPEECRREQAIKAHNLVLVLSAGTAMLLAAACPLIPFVYGRPFLASIVPALVCLPGCILRGGSSVLYYFYAAEDRQYINLLSHTLGLVTMVALDLLLIPRLGIAGAAAGYAASIFLTYSFSLWLGLRSGLLPGLGYMVPTAKQVGELLAAVKRVWAAR